MMYRWHAGYVAWLLNRITGILITFYLVMHIWVIHHLAHGPVVKVDGRKLNPAYQAHYVTYDLATKKRTDHGPLMAAGDRRVCHADTLAILPDGRLFSLAWVETVDPARIKEMKALAKGRRLYSKMKKNGPYYEVQLVELPTMGK